MRKSTFKHGRRFKPLALAALPGLLLLSAYPQTTSVVARQDPPGAKTQIAYIPNITGPRSDVEDDARLPDLSSLDLSQLIRESDRMGTTMHLRLPEYTYLQRRFSRELDRRGKLVEHSVVYEAYPITIRGRHRHVISMISEDGAPVSPRRLKNERRQAAEEIERAERENTGGAPSTGAEKYVTAGIGVSQTGDGVWVGVSQFLRRCQFGAPRYSRLAERDMIALDIHSCAAGAGDPRERYLAGMTGIVWIDAADKVVACLQAWPKPLTTGPENPLTSADKETIVYEQMRLPGGLWVPKRIRLNAIGKAALFNGTDKDMTFEFSHYQRFAIEVKDIQQTTLKSKD
ncbi:MAG TPA: hypothetical protein VFS27_06610 [Blastocatellia bacterium]|jgi:hypothetical protein|nr:hypothetical protein [Blastocatellia bacterium]